MSLRPRSTVALVLIAAATACTRPAPPVLTPRSCSITESTSSGLRLRVNLTARNPNGIAVTVRRIDADVTVGGQDLGRTRVDQITRLPSRVDVPLTVDLSVPWGNALGLIMASAMNENIPYRINGTANVGGENVNFNVPFRVESTMPRSVLTGALPNSVPGLPPLPWRR